MFRPFSFSALSPSARIWLIAVFLRLVVSLKSAYSIPPHMVRYGLVQTRGDRTALRSAYSFAHTCSICIRVAWPRLMKCSSPLSASCFFGCMGPRSMTRRFLSVHSEIKTIRHIGFQFASQVLGRKRQIKGDHGSHSGPAMFQEHELSRNGRGS